MGKIKKIFSIISPHMNFQKKYRESEWEKYLYLYIYIYIYVLYVKIFRLYLIVLLLKWKPELELKYRVSVPPTSLFNNTPANILRHFFLPPRRLVARPDTFERRARPELNPILTPPSRTSIITWLTTGIDYESGHLLYFHTLAGRLYYL